MAANVPAGLKRAAITPFLVRAAQLEKAKPIVSYWCNYYVVNRILAEKLHHTDDECLNFTMALMDKLEQVKTEEASNDAVHDDLAGQTYVEQFADETMERAMRPLKANKVTQQTALTFEAAATFFNLLSIWGPLRPEIEKKVQFAKWNAVRILKALKAGQDPNESNPKPQEDELEELDPNDPEAQAMGLVPAPTVEDAPDQGEPSRLDPRASAVSPASVSAPTSPPQDLAPAHEQVSPIAPPDEPATEGYFPSAPAPAADDPLQLPSAPALAVDDPLQLPSAPGAAPGAPPSAGDPDLSIPSPPTVVPDLERRSPTLPPPGPVSPPALPDTPNSFYRAPPPAQQPRAPTTLPHNYPPSQPAAPPSNSVYHQPPQPLPPPAQPPVASAPPPAAPPVQPAQSYSGGPPTNAVYNADDMAMAQAQKHAKWAISALNFEDVPTAVRELKAALAQLGAN